MRKTNRFAQKRENHFGFSDLNGISIDFISRRKQEVKDLWHIWDLSDLLNSSAQGNEKGHGERATVTEATVSWASVSEATFCQMA